MKNPWALALASALLACQPGAPQDLKAKEIQGRSLEAQATILKKEAAQVDENLKAFALHADAYNQSELHKRLLKGRTRGNSRQRRGHSFAAGTTSRLQNTHELREEYEQHVIMLRGLVDQYRDLYKGYAAHCDQYKAELQRYSVEMQQANMGLQTSKFKVSSTRQMGQLGASEKELITVVKKMGVLEEKSPTLPESYLCPAYDDLHKEFVQALDELVAAIKALPKEEKGLALHEELARLKALQQEMEDAEHLHDEQKSLQAEFTKLQKTFSDVNNDHQDLLNLSKKLPNIQLPAPALK